MRRGTYRGERNENVDNNEETFALFVLEKGADWPSWGAAIRQRADNAVVETRIEGETEEEFERRVLHRLERVQQKGVRLVSAGYICGLDGTFDPERRHRLTLAIVRALADRPDSELVLGGGAWDATGREGAAREAMMELWGQLSGDAPGRLISVRFEQPPESSGVYAVTDAAAVQAESA